MATNYDRTQRFMRALESARVQQEIIEGIGNSSDSLFILPSMEKQGQFAYSRTPDDHDNDKRRVRTTFPRIVRRQLALAAGIISDTELDRQSRALVATIWPDFSAVEILRGREIVTGYEDYKNTSCMGNANGENNAWKTILYADNPNNVEMLYIRDKDGKGVAKALVWVTDDFQFFLDRVYGKYADQQAIAAFAREHYPDIIVRPIIESGRPQGYEDLTVTVQYDARVSHYPLPYMDSFCSGEMLYPAGTLVLSMGQHSDYFHSQNGDGIAKCNQCGDRYFQNDDNGGVEGRACSDCGGGQKCSNCDSRLDTDSIYTGPDGEAYCESCYSDIFATCDICGNEHTREDITTVDDEFVCPGCLSTYYTQCHDCDDYFRTSAPGYRRNVSIVDMVEYDGELYCPNCADEKFTECTTCGEILGHDEEVTIDFYVYCSDCAAEIEAAAEAKKTGIEPPITITQVERMIAEPVTVAPGQLALAFAESAVTA